MCGRGILISEGSRVKGCSGRLLALRLGRRGFIEKGGRKI